MTYKFAEPVRVNDAGVIAHPGGLVRTIIEAHNLSISSTARAIMMDRATLSKVTTGEHMVSRDLAYKMGALLGDQIAALLINAVRRFEDQEGDRLLQHYKSIINKVAA